MYSLTDKNFLFVGRSKRNLTLYANGKAASSCGGRSFLSDLGQLSTVLHHVRRKNTERFTRVFHALPIGKRPQKVVLHGHEQYCRRCRNVLREPIDLAKPKGRSLRALERFEVKLCAISQHQGSGCLPGGGMGLGQRDLSRKICAAV